MASFVTQTVKVRGRDNYGSGEYGASRDGGKRQHKGLDIVSNSGQAIYAPILGDVTVTRAYSVDSNATKEAMKKDLQCVKITDSAKKIVVKLMYVKATVRNGFVSQGQIIGYVQNLGNLYPGITNHVHVEYLVNGNKVHPEELWQICFNR